MSLRGTITARALAALVLGAVVPATAFGQNTGSPVSAPTPAPTASPSGTPVPYPAYGTPAPDVSAQQQRPGIPVAITLQQAIDIAVAQSPAFASQRAQYEAIAARYGAEKGALFPNVSAVGDLTRSYGAASNGTGSTSGTGTGGTGNTGSTTGTDTVTSESLRASLTQLIYDGGRVIAGIRSSKEADVAGRDTLLRQLQTLAYNVATAYYAVLQANATVDADAQIVRQFETQENNVRAQIATGAAARSDLAAAQFQTAQARGALVTAQSSAIGAEATFTTTLGLDADTAANPQPVSNPTAVRTLTYPQALAAALTLRPDFLAAQHTVESSKENLRFAKLARFPQLTANASTGTARTLISSPPVATPFSASSTLGATLTIPIYDQGLTNYNVAVAASQLDQADAGLIQTKLTVESDVRGALANLVSARAALTQAQAELQSAQVNLQATQARYRVGAATITDLVTAEANLATGQRDEINALYNERLGEERYAFALGTSDLKLQ